MKTLIITALLLIGSVARANILDEFNPFDPNAEAIVNYFDQVQELEIGTPAQPPAQFFHASSCRREACPVFVLIDKATQTFNLMVNGEAIASWPTSTGATGYETPNFDRNPNGRIYEAYMSRKYPGKDYQGLGNMPYAVFIEGGFAIHGTESTHKLGSAVSHGCIRLEPTNAQLFNSLVRKYGIYKVWITVR